MYIKTEVHDDITTYVVYFKNTVIFNTLSKSLAKKFISDLEKEKDIYHLLFEIISKEIRIKNYYNYSEKEKIWVETISDYKKKIGKLEDSLEILHNNYKIKIDYLNKKIQDLTNKNNNILLSMENSYQIFNEQNKLNMFDENEIEEYANFMFCLKSGVYPQSKLSQPWTFQLYKKMADKFNTVDLFGFTDTEKLELSKLIIFFYTAELKYSADLSNYIVKNGLGNLFPNLTGVMEMSNGRGNYEFKGAINPKIYSLVCRILELNNYDSGAVPVAFTSFNNL